MNEWESNYARLNEWVLRTESLIDVSPGSTHRSTFDELSVDEQLILWEDLETELSANEQVCEEAMKNAQELIKLMKLGKSSKSIVGTKTF